MIRHKSAAAAVLAIGVLAAGCGSSGHSSTGGTSATTSGSAATSPAPSGASGAAGAAATTGISAKTITIGQLADVGGPVPGLFQGAVDGLDAWAAYVNSTGGINGRKVVIDHKDSALNCNTYSTGMKSLATSVFANVGSFSEQTACGIPTLKANPDFVDLESAVIDSTIEPLPNVFSPEAAPPGYSTTGYQYVKDTFGAAAVAKSATLYSTGAQTAYKEESQTAESIGYKWVYSRGVGLTDSNFTSDILRMKADGVEVVDLTATNVIDTVDFLQQAQQQGFNPKAVIGGTAYDSSYFKLAGGNKNLGSNLQLVLPYAMYLGEDASTVPEINTLTTWFKKTHPKDPMNLFAVDAFSAGLMFQQAMTKAGANPTRGSFLTAVKGVNNFNADGLLPTSDPGVKIPPHCVVMATVKDGKFVREDPKTTGFECNGVFHSVKL